MFTRTKTNQHNVKNLENECRVLFDKLEELQIQIHKKLSTYSDGKTLKGNELVGWLGEIYGKLFLNGSLVDDSEEHDLITQDGERVSVKTRRGFKNGWRRSSAIPKFEGEECPTHLLFVHLSNDYSVDRMWLYNWKDLIAKNRFTTHKVRKEHRSFIFTVDEKRDKQNLVYPQLEGAQES